MYAPGTQMIHTLEGLTDKTEGQSPKHGRSPPKKEVSWVLGIYSLEVEDLKIGGTPKVGKSSKHHFPGANS